MHSSGGEDILHSAPDRGSPGISLEVELRIYELRFQGPQKASKGLSRVIVQRCSSFGAE